MRQENTNNWKDLAKDYQFLGHYQQFFKAETRSELPNLNYLQLKSLPDISGTNKNLLICAPTGAGKSLVFKMIILNSVFKYYIKPQKDFSNFKVLYMAPTRAVCEQKQQQFQKLGQLLNLSVKYIRNAKERQEDSVLQILLQSNIIICTPEMCSYILRKHSQSIMDDLDLFLVDEIHMIGCDQRGCNLEIIMERFLDTQRSLGANSNMRIASVSASIPNRDLIARWLNADLIFSDRRQVPLRLIKAFDSQTLKNPDFQSRNKNLIHQLYKIIKSRERSNTFITDRRINNYLAFCISRFDAKRNCQEFTKKMKEDKFKFRNYKGCGITPEKLEQLLIQYKIEKEQLKQSLRHRIGYHHANLLENEKQLVILLMRQKWIVVLFSTTTLAQGVNLPVQTVVIMMMARMQDDTEIPYLWRQIDQMMGRAGRDISDQQGYCIFLDRKESLREIYETYDPNTREFDLSNKIEPIQSNLKESFPDFLFFQIAYRQITLTEQNVEILVEHFKKSLWALELIQQKCNPIQLEKMIREKIKKTTVLFEDYHLVDPRIKDEIFRESIFSVETFVQLLNFMRSEKQQCAFSHKRFLEAICYIKEIALVYYYAKNDDLLGQIKKIVKVPIVNKFTGQSDKRKYSRNKAMLLIQIVLQGQLNKLNGNPQIQLESIEILELFFKACKLLRKVCTWFPEYSSPGIIYFTELYLKYRRIAQVNPEHPEQIQYSSHMNIQKCFHLAEITELKLKRDMKKQCKQIGFFAIKKVFHQNPPNLTPLFSDSHQRKNRAKQKFDEYKLIQIQEGDKVTLQLMSKCEIEFHIFKKQNGSYVFQEKTSNKKTFLNQDLLPSKYLILLIFKQEIGLDSVYLYEFGKLTEVFFSNIHFQVNQGSALQVEECEHEEEEGVEND